MIRAEVVHRQYLHRASANSDKMNKLYPKSFISKLGYIRWINEEMIAVKNFGFKHEGHAEKRSNCIEWRAEIRLN